MIMGKVEILLRQNNNQKSDHYGEFYGRVRQATPVDAVTLGELTAMDSKIEKSEVIDVYDAQSKQIKELVCNGHAIKVEGLGTFKVGISSKGVSEADVKKRYPQFDPETEDIRKYLSVKQITKARLLFTPCDEIKQALRSVKFETNKTEWKTQDTNNNNNG